MKKFLATILCFIYVVASSGATVNFHYCMGKFTGWDVSASAPETCGNCGMHKEKKQGCCNDETATFSIKKDQLASTINYIPANDFIYIQPQYLSYTNAVLNSNAGVIKHLHSPPLIFLSSSFILNCVFRI